jgi:hypothetical protein
MAGFFRGFALDAENSDAGALSTDGWSTGPSRGWLDANAALDFGRVSDQEAAAGWLGWAGVERLPSSAASRPTSLKSAGSGSSGGSGASPPDPAIAAILQTRSRMARSATIPF